MLNIKAMKNNHPRRLAYVVILGMAMSLCIGTTSSAQTSGQDLPGVSIAISPSASSISSGQNLSVSVTLTNLSGRTLSLDSCFTNAGLAMVSVRNSALKGPPLKTGARDKVLCQSHGESTSIPNGSSITASESVTALFDLTQTGVYSLTKTIELYDQAFQKHTYTAVPVQVTVVQP